ncbi:MAG: hypothetical protein U0271_21470 [Polyangiaceae bacterium]
MSKKFSASQFEAAWREGHARVLSDELQDEVQLALHPSILQAVHEVVRALNEMGHSLSEYTPSRAGDLSYRDSSDGARCKLRVGVDVVISVGYADTDGQ